MACIPQRPLSAAECSYAGVSSGAWRENQLVNHLWSLSWCSVHMAVPSAAEHSYDEVSCVELTEGTVGRSLSIIQSSEFKGMLCFRGMMTWQFSAERFFLFFFFFSLWGKAAHFNKVFWCTSRPVLDKILVLTFQIILHTVGASVYSDSVWWFGGWCDGVFLHGGLFPHYVKTPDTQCNRNTFDVIWNKHNNPFLFLSLLWLCALKKKKLYTSAQCLMIVVIWSPSDYPLHLWIFMFGWYEQCALMVLAHFGQHHHDAQELVMVWQVAEQQASDAEQHRKRTDMVIMATLHWEEDTIVTVNPWV